VSELILVLRWQKEPWGNYLLKDLVETPLPQSISWWPQTPAWAFLALIILIFVAYKGYQQWRLYQHNAYRRSALLWLSQLPPYESLNPDENYRQLPALLRQVASVGYGGPQVSQLPRSNWEQWLDSQCNHCDFSSGSADLLHQLAYQTNIQISAAQMQLLINTITQWIKHHGGRD